MRREPRGSWSEKPGGKAPAAAFLPAFLLTLVSSGGLGAGDPPPYRSPFDLAFSPDGEKIAVSDRTAGRAVIVDVEAARIEREVDLEGRPTGVAWSADSSRVFVCEYGAGSVAEVDAGSGEVSRRLPAGLRPVGCDTAPGRRLLVVANTVTDDVSVVDLERGREVRRLRVPREPYFVTVSPDESLAVVGNLLPSGSAADPTLAAAVSLIDLEALEVVADIRLPPGSTSVRELAVSPDGRRAYVVHTVGRFNVPATQLERGWVNTNALSILDLAGRRHHATVLLDNLYEGAADPWGLALSPDGTTLWISLRGVHRLARVDVERLVRLLEGESHGTIADPSAYAASARTIWHEIRRDPEARRLLVNDLSALYVADLIEKHELPGRGPRGLDISPDGRKLAAALYYSGSIALIDAGSRRASTLRLGPEREPDPARRGEMIFHDATVCFQRWMSCSTCHPDEGRTDGLRWDLTNDGIGTPQRTRSLLLSHAVRPTTARGVRGGIEESVPKGLLFFLHEPDPALVEPLIAYLRSLEPEPSPRLVGGELSEAARRGKEIFAGKGRCARCHEGELGTDLEAHDIGTSEFDRPDDVFYTPKLVELYRTAPFLHDGRAATLRDVFTVHDPEKRHGKASELEPRELDDLIEYLESR